MALYLRFRNAARRGECLPYYQIENVATCERQRVMIAKIVFAEFWRICTIDSQHQLCARTVDGRRIAIDFRLLLVYNAYFISG